LAGNLERLEDAGLIVKRPLPEAHSKVVEALSDAEVDVIVSVAARLRKADRDEDLVVTAVCPYFIHF
jgi:hypothetical protein